MAKPAAPKVNDLVLVDHNAPALYVITDILPTTRDGFTTSDYTLLLVGPPRPNSPFGRVVRTVPEADILAVYRAA